MSKFWLNSLILMLLAVPVAAQEDVLPPEPPDAESAPSALPDASAPPDVEPAEPIPPDFPALEPESPDSAVPIPEPPDQGLAEPEPLDSEEMEPEPPDSAVVEEASSEASPRPALGLRFFRGSPIAITEVIADSPAEIAGLRPGDMIVQINGEPVVDTDEFILRVAAAEFEEPLELLVVNDSERRYVTLTPAAWSDVYPAEYSSARPELTDDAEVITPRAAHFGVPYHPTNFSPVVVPYSWYVPYSAYYTAGWYWPGWYYYSYYGPAAYYAPFYYAPFYTYYYYPWWGIYHPTGIAPTSAVAPVEGDSDNSLDSTQRDGADESAADLTVGAR